MAAALTAEFQARTNHAGTAVLRNEARAVETEIKFAGYLEQQKKSIEKLKAAEAVAIPEWLEYGAISGLSREMRETLERVRPVTIGQASRIPGVTPAALSLVHVSIRMQGRPELASQVSARSWRSEYLCGHSFVHKTHCHRGTRQVHPSVLLSALVASGEERDVEGHLGVGLLLGLGVGVFAQRRCAGS